MADDIGRWLEDLGLSKYVDVFAENEIDSNVLPDLSETDFEKICIPMGPRKKMLRAIEEFNVAAQGTVSTVEARVGRATSALVRAPAADGDVLRFGQVNRFQQLPRFSVHRAADGNDTLAIRRQDDSGFA